MKCQQPLIFLFFCAFSFVLKAQISPNEELRQYLNPDYISFQFSQISNINLKSERYKQLTLVLGNILDLIQLQFKEPSLFNDVDNRDGALSDYLVHLEMVFDIYPNSINDMPACATAKRYLLAQYQPEEYKFEKLPHSIQMFWPAFEGLCSNTENDILLPLESAKTLKPEFIN